MVVIQLVCRSLAPICDFIRFLILAIHILSKHHSFYWVGYSHPGLRFSRCEQCWNVQLREQHSNTFSGDIGTPFGGSGGDNIFRGEFSSEANAKDATTQPLHAESIQLSWFGVYPYELCTIVDLRLCISTG
mmetsp:Transcript_11238/g.20879  ORF Transcript_11238/g.20879 Transcript_11238/m.20879 type:complete len:131 (-) Transcript_11238:2584-2976(-)